MLIHSSGFHSDVINNGGLGTIKHAEDSADVIITLVWKHILIEPRKLHARFERRVVDAPLGSL